MYNLKVDIGEQKDIAKEFPDEVKKLDALRKKWDSELIEPIFASLIMKKISKEKQANDDN